MIGNECSPIAHTVPEACHRIGLSRTVVYELLGKGEIRFFKVGNRTLIPESELQRFVAEKMAMASSFEKNSKSES